VISSLRAYDSLMIADQSLETLKITQKKVKELRAALDHHTAVSVTDLAGKITYVNELFCQISQYSQEELLGKEHHMLASGSHPKAFIQEVWQCITQGHTWHGVFKNRAKDGNDYCLKTTIIPIFNTHGKPANYLAIHTKTEST
jgi:PAS domain S-box-containing protein